MACFLRACLALFMLVAPVAAAQPLDLPQRKPGQWEVRAASEKPPGGFSMQAQMCIDPATDRELMDFGLRMSKDSCKRYEMKRAGQTWIIDAECALGPVKSVTKTTISGDFQSTVTIRTEGTTEGMPGGGSGPQAMLMTQSARWVSAACGNGMKAGDIMLDNGIKLNIKQLKALPKLLLR